MKTWVGSGRVTTQPNPSTNSWTRVFGPMGQTHGSNFLVLKISIKSYFMKQILAFSSILRAKVSFNIHFIRYWWVNNGLVVFWIWFTEEDNPYYIIDPRADPWVWTHGSCLPKYGSWNFGPNQTQVQKSGPIYIPRPDLNAEKNGKFLLYLVFYTKMLENRLKPLKYIKKTWWKR